MTYEFHPFADVFPLLVGYDLDKLTEDIEENGQREPIILYDGKILDGRNRYRACIDLGIEPHFAQSTATNDEQALRESVSRNLRRRHLSPSQRSLAGAQILPMF
jgi:ParB-like chromosome segregation protein Spo0J